MSRLAGKVAVVIGGRDGIGGAVAQRFAAEDARVYATSRLVDEGEYGGRKDGSMFSAERPVDGGMTQV